eukprot:540887_1
MDPTQLFATLKPILDDIHRLQQPSSNAKLFSKQWSQCTVSLDKLISLLSTYPSLMDTVHPIPNFSSSISCTIPPSYSSQTISKFTCVPYFIYTQNTVHPIPNFSSSISCTIPPSYSSQTISKFTCVPYFIYTQN